jgi:hypothetical protein
MNLVSLPQRGAVSAASTNSKHRENHNCARKASRFEIGLF